MFRDLAYVEGDETHPTIWEGNCVCREAGRYFRMVGHVGVRFFQKPSGMKCHLRHGMETRRFTVKKAACDGDILVLRSNKTVWKLQSSSLWSVQEILAKLVESGVDVWMDPDVKE